MNERDEIHHSLISKLLPNTIVNRHETKGLILAFLCAFTMFVAYSILRPIRETMGVTSGVSSLPWMFWSTLGLTLVAQPILGKLMTKVRLATLLPRIYTAFAFVLLAFYAWFLLQSDHTWISRAYFIWVSVLNLLVVSLFWSLMADTFTEEQAGRMFGVIAGGLSLGGLVGSLLAGWLAEVIGTINLLLVSAALLWNAGFLMTKVTLWRAGEGGNVPISHVDEKLTGNALDGFSQIFRSPFLMGVALFVVLLTSATTILYVEQNRIVGEFVASTDARTALFGKIDFGVQLAALVGQFFFFGPLMRRWGLDIVLATSPVLMMGAFLVLWKSPSLSVVIAAMVVRRVSEYAFAKPSRDLLFTGVSRSEKYRAKSVLDTFVYRGGDAVSASMYQGATVAAGHSIAGMSGMAVSAVWLVVSLWLASKFRRQRADSEVTLGERSTHVKAAA